MAGAISARGMGSVESQAVVWKAAQTECTSYAMGLQDRDREESVATEVCVRLWTRDMVAKLVLDKFGISLSANSVGRLLAQLGITCQKPLHRAQERDEALVEQWLKKEYPKIKALAQREKAEIFFGDAAHMRSDHHAGRSWGKKGETPVVETTGARHGMSLISAITSRGQMRFMIKEKGGVNAAVFIEFLKRLITGAGSHPSPTAIGSRSEGSRSVTTGFHGGDMRRGCNRRGGVAVRGDSDRIYKR